MRKRIFATLLALVMALGLTATAWADDPVTGVEYVDADGTTKTCTDYTMVESSDSMVTWGEAGKTKWYVVKGDVTIETVNPDLINNSHYIAVNVIGTVNLILCDGATLNVKQRKGETNRTSFGIYLSNSSQLTIYGQSEGTGQLVAKTNLEHLLFDAAIRNEGTLTINGGNVTANGSSVGIRNRHGDLTINGGKLTATGEISNSDGINNDGRIKINSGTVIASGTRSGIYNYVEESTLTLPASYRWRTAANGVYTASTDTSYSLGGEPYIEITTTAPVVTPPADEPEPEPEQEPSAPAHEPIRRQHVTAVEDTADTADTTKADEAKTDTVTSAKTFDAGVAVYGAMAVASLLGMGYVGKKRV